MKKFQQIIDLCKQEFGERVLYTEIEQKDTGSTLYISLDASNEAENNAFYPTIQNGELKLVESWSNSLNLFMQANNKAHFYYQGFIQTNKNGKKYSEPVDDEGLEIEADTVFSLEVNTPEEAVEWLRFIFKYRDGSLSVETKAIHLEEHPASRWFEEPRVFLPGVSDKLVSLSKVMASFNVFNLPALYDKAHHLGGRSMSESDNDFDKFTAEISAMNQEGQAELEEIGKVFSALTADSNDRVQPGDFLTVIGLKGLPFTWSDYQSDPDEFSDVYFLVLRPSKGTSYPALYDFLMWQEEGRKFISQLRDPQKGISDTLRFIPDSEAQQQFILFKKTGLTQLQQQLNRFKYKSLSPDESIRRIEEARKLLEGLLEGTVNQE